MKHSKIAIIGTGRVGSTTAYALLLKNITAEVMLVDADEIRCKGELFDLSDTLPYSVASKLTKATAKDAAQADIIIITAGKAQTPGRSRAELVGVNQKIMSSIFKSMQPINPQAIVIMVTNPVDTLTQYAQEISGLPRQQVFGSGTLLDSQRIRGAISKKVGIAAESIDAYILGEHGDTQFPVWSSAYIAGLPLSSFPELSAEALAEIAADTKNKAYEIIECKGSTYYGVASCVAAMCESIMFDKKELIPLSCYIESLGVCLSMPAVLGEKGIEKILELPMNEQEKELLQKSAQMLLDLKKQCQ